MARSLAKRTMPFGKVLNNIGHLSFCPGYLGRQLPSLVMRSVFIN